MNVKNLVRPWLHSLEPYPPGKPIDELEREYGVTDSIKLASNENPLGPSPKALAALQSALADVHRYPDGSCYHLRRALARRLKVAPETLIFGNGSNEIIELIVRAFLHAGEEAVMADQAFVIYRMLVQAQGGKGIIVPLRNYTHDLEAMAEAITPSTRLVFIANPNNPTGTIFFREPWEEFLAAVPRDVVIVMDEAYAEFVEDPRYPDALADVGGDHLLIVLRTFSKIYGLAGLRVGYGVAHPAIIDLLNRLRAPFNVNTLAQVAALAALDDDAHVERTRQGNREGMAMLREALTGLGYECVPSWANFILVRVGNAARLYDALLRLGVIVRPVPVYGFPEHVRVTVGTPAENARLIAALTKLKGEEEGRGVAL
jgi:histidinol-phosphate aminotransferase